MWKRIKQELKTQYLRYSRHVYGKIGAILIYATVFSLVPVVLTHLLPIVQSYLAEPETAVLILSTAIMTTIAVWNLVMMWVYTAKLPFFEQYRVNPDKLWPWESDPQKWRDLLSRSIKYTVTSFLLYSPALLLLDFHLAPTFPLVMDMSLCPSWIQMLPQLFIMLLIEDFVFFWTHWAFHHPLLYKFHKVHHEYNITVAIAGLHFHFLEFFISQIVSAKIYITASLLYAPLHINTLVIWYIFRVWDAHNGHCGYVFPWTPLQLLPFCTNDEFHDFHHTRNSGNYGSQFRFWDTFFGTNKVFRDYKAKQELQWQKKHAKTG